MIETVDEAFKLLAIAIGVWVFLIVCVIWKAGKESEPS
jgi:hypothetical protein